MATNEQAREQLAQERQHNQQLQDTLLSRTQAELNHPEESKDVTEQAREALAEQRHQEKHLQQSMLERTEEEVQS